LVKLLKKLFGYASDFGLEVADKVSSFVGTWTFVFIYTATMLVWIALHKFGYLHVDGPDFIKWNLWLSYFAGTQASIVLMSSARQTAIDRKRDRQSMELDYATLEQSRKSNERILVLIKQISELEDIIDDLTKDKKDV